MKLKLGLIGAAMAAAAASGCGVVPPALPNAVSGLTLGTVQQIQNDGTLDATERQQILRAMLGVADDDAGNRLVTFVLALSVP